MAKQWLRTIGNVLWWTFCEWPRRFGLGLRTFELRPKTCNLRPRICDLMPKTFGLRPRTSGLVLGTCGLRLRTFDLRHLAWNPPVLGLKPYDPRLLKTFCLRTWSPRECKLVFQGSGPCLLTGQYNLFVLRFNPRKHGYSRTNDTSMVGFVFGSMVHFVLQPCHSIFQFCCNSLWSFCHGVLGLRPPCPRLHGTLSWRLGSQRSECLESKF